MSIRIPLHRKGDVSVHRQLMVNASGGRGFRPDFMARTMVEQGVVGPEFLLPERSDRSKRRAFNRTIVQAMCAASPSRSLRSVADQRASAEAIKRAGADFVAG